MSYTLLQTINKIKNQGFTPEILSKYSKDEIHAIHLILDEIEEHGRSETLEGLWSNDFDEVPVSIDEFLEDDFYLGRVGKNIFPIWREELRTILSPYSEVGEVIFQGGIGTGKTTIGLIILVYKMYYLTC